MGHGAEQKAVWWEGVGGVATSELIGYCGVHPVSSIMSALVDPRHVVGSEGGGREWGGRGPVLWASILQG